MRRLLLAAMVMVGCGGDDPSLDGTWGLQVNSACGVGLNFDTKAGTYVEIVLCALASGSYGSELEAGDADYSVPGQISMVPRRTSCPTSEHVADVTRYSFDNGRLVLTNDRVGVTAVFERTPMGGMGTAVIVSGCTNETGFVPHPVEPLP